MEANFKTHQSLMPYRIREILIISSPYDAFIMEEDGGLMEHVFTNYRGISLVYPPKFTVAHTAQEALELLEVRNFDLVVTMSRLLGMDAITLGKEIKSRAPNLPVVLLAHSAYGLRRYTENIEQEASIDHVFIWSGNRNILWAIVKWLEDKLNVAHDTEIAMVRVLILVEDSPQHYSSILPLLYEALVEQTQVVLDDSLNEEHRLLKLRARPKILHAQTYEEGMKLYEKFQDNLLGIFSDIRFPRNGHLDPDAGLDFLKHVKYQKPHLPVLLVSTDKHKAHRAEEVPCFFMDKNSPTLHDEILDFLIDHLGFGDFVFKKPNGEEVHRVSNIADLEQALKIIPDESLQFHITRNHFSSWLMARSEIQLASTFQNPDPQVDITDLKQVRKYLIKHIHRKRVSQQRGVIAQFKKSQFDAESDFLKVGHGSLGGKARGLAFMSRCLQKKARSFEKKYKNVEIKTPQTVVLTTDCFDQFVQQNKLRHYAKKDVPDHEIAEAFSNATLPQWLIDDLKCFIKTVDYPIAVRSSSLLEDSQFQPYAGLYKTYMLPNNHPDPGERFRQLEQAIKLVYSSIFYLSPKAFSKATQHRTEEEKMAVLIQKLTGNQYGDYFYPSISGTAQSHNFYPVSYMESKDGIANIGVGLGKIVVEEGQAIRFCPKYPQFLPQFSNVEETMKNSQQYFFALDMKSGGQDLGPNDEENLIRREIDEATDEFPIRSVCSTYFATDHRIRDSFSPKGSPVVTCASLLKYDMHFPLGEILADVLDLGKESLACDFEMEFAFTLTPNEEGKYEFMLLQVRPVATQDQGAEEISDEEIEEAFCYSTNALGEGKGKEINHVILVKPESFSPTNTLEVKQEISNINARLASEGQKYMLVGPGRWGSSDRMLGIPVGWQDISNVAAIIEASTDTFRADPSQGTHFFQNITSLGIIYITIYRNEDKLDWNWFRSQEILEETEHLLHIRTYSPMTIKIDGRKNRGIIKP